MRLKIAYFKSANWQLSIDVQPKELRQRKLPVVRDYFFWKCFSQRDVFQIIVVIVLIIIIIIFIIIIIIIFIFIIIIFIYTLILIAFCSCVCVCVCVPLCTNAYSS